MQELKWFEETDRLSRLQAVIAAKPGWTLVDASDLTDEQFEEAVGTARAKGAAPPHATWFVRPDRTRQRILLYLHHVIVDGWSVPIGLREVLGILEGSER